MLSPVSGIPALARLHLPFFRCSTTERTGEKDVECIRGKASAEIDVDRLAAGVAGYDDVLIDIGTGDGRYLLHVAQTRPTWFAVGVDACRDNLREASRKAPPNALYVIANALALPMELGGMASKVTINSPGAACSRRCWMESPYCWRDCSPSADPEEPDLEPGAADARERQLVRTPDTRSLA
jgi:hypothetical protein